MCNNDKSTKRRNLQRIVYFFCESKITVFLSTQLTWKFTIPGYIGVGGIGF